MSTAFIGIDVACAKGKRLPIAVGSWHGSRFLPLPLRTLGLPPPRAAGNVLALDPAWREEFAQQVVDYVRHVEARCNVTIKRVGIDAPASYRAEAADCRASERELGLARISYFKTPTRTGFGEILAKARAHLADRKPEARLPHANQLWMLVGFALYDALGAHWECIEVYPQATVKAMQSVGVLPDDALHKTVGLAALEQLRANSLFSRWPYNSSRSEVRNVAYAPLHDAVDAYVAAYTASLEPHQRRYFGTPPDDAIWVPNYSKLENYDGGDGRPGAEEIELDEEDEAILDAIHDLRGAEQRRRS